MTVPAPSVGLEPEVANLVHLSDWTPDLEETSWFFGEFMGLQATARTDQLAHELRYDGGKRVPQRDDALAFWRVRLNPAAAAKR